MKEGKSISEIHEAHLVYEITDTGILKKYKDRKALGFSFPDQIMSDEMLEILKSSQVIGQKIKVVIISEKLTIIAKNW